MRLVVHDPLEQPRRVGADGFGPMHHARGRPFQMRTMTPGAMLVIGDGLPASAAAQVRSDARAFVQDLYRGGRGTDLDQLMHQVVGHAVEVRIEVT